VELYQQAADQGHLFSIHNLGVCYEKGTGVEKNAARAVELYQQAADQGHLGAMYSLAYCKFYGEGTEQDCSGAFEMLSELADKNHARALSLLGESYLSGVGTPNGASTLEAEKLLRRSLQCDPNLDDSLFFLASILASSHDPGRLREARDLVNRISDKSHVYLPSRWLLPFIEERLVELENWNWRVQPEPDFMSDAELQLIAKIGQGHFGTVYLARLRRERWAAVKYISADIDEDSVRNILRERFTCQVVDAHDLPGCVKYLGFVDDQGHSQRGLVFELCADIASVDTEAEAILAKGFISARFADIESLPDWSMDVRSSLRSFVVLSDKRKKEWSVTKIVGMLKQVADSLLEVHKLGFLHRDIADRNVLCDAEGNVKLADFGLTKFVGSELDDSGRMAVYRTYFTPGHQYAIAWWPPECVGKDKRGAIFSTNSDVYSFGVLMWQCFSHHDPFDDVDSSDDAGEEIAKRILNGERPDLDLLDDDTPKDLVNLMERCWETDPEDRPTLKEVIDELTRIEAMPPTKCRDVVTSARIVKRMKENWFNKNEMYRKFSLRKLMQLAKASKNRGDFRHRYLAERTRVLGHVVSPSRTLSAATLRRFSDRRPYDLFLVHTGPQKMVEVAGLEECLTSAGFNCFLDREMRIADGAPSEKMRFALETSRYAVVVISKEFLTKPDPCAELVYAFQRMQWLRKFYRWESLWIILYRVTVSEYKVARASSSLNLPDICDQKVLREWSDGKGYTWPEQCRYLKAEIVEHDNGVAVDRWKKFLKEWDSPKDEPFPRAASVYKRGSAKRALFLLFICFSSFLLCLLLSFWLSFEGNGIDYCPSTKY